MENKEIIEQSSVKDRLKMFLDYKKISQTEFEKQTSLSNGYVNNMRKSIKVDTFDEKIAPIFPELNKYWLLHNEGQMLKETTNSKEEEGDMQITGYYYPNVDAAAGLDRAMFNEEIERVPVYLPNFGKGIDFINVYGDSMYPRYNAGEIIGIKHTEFQYLNYGYPYVVVFKNGDVFIKYVRKGKDDEHILLASENPIYEPREFHLELIKDFYSIRGVVKKEMM